MARKPRVEGQSYAAIVQGSEAERAPGLAGIVEAFKKAHPDKWEAIRLCPMQHGLEEMIACLNS